VRRCSRCGLSKPSIDFSRRSKSPDGLAGYCKFCAREVVRQWRNTPRKAALSIPNGQKRCSCCDSIKPTTEFYNHPDTRDGHQAHCKDCCRSRVQNQRTKDLQKAWRIANVDRVRLLKQTWYRANRSRFAERVKEWRKRNPERAAALDANRRRDARPEIKSETTIRRRANQYGAEGSFSHAEWLSVVSRFKGKCVCCGQFFWAARKRANSRPYRSTGPRRKQFNPKYPAAL
jgi:hypothetical protein